MCCTRSHSGVRLPHACHAQLCEGALNLINEQYSCTSRQVYYVLLVLLTCRCILDFVLFISCKEPSACICFPLDCTIRFRMFAKL